MLELLAPAGNMDKLKTAFYYGADACYFAGTKYYKLDFNFNGYEKTLTNNSGNIVYFVKKFDNGKVFDGFTDGLVKLTVKFGAIKNQSESKVVFNSITNQNLTSYALEEGDLQGPQISLCDKMITPNFGETLVIPKAVAYDFFCGKSTLTKSKLIKPDGTSVNLDPTKDTLIACDQYGVYSIEYSAEDANGNISRRSYTVKVEDKESPNIVLGANKSEYQVGQSLSDVVYNASDNVKIKSEQIFVRDFNGKMTLVSDEYIFGAKGRYEIYVKVTDTNGNSHYESFIVMVVNGDKK